MSNVSPGSAADVAGLRIGDRIVEVRSGQMEAAVRLSEAEVRLCLPELCEAAMVSRAHKLVSRYTWLSSSALAETWDELVRSQLRHGMRISFASIDRLASTLESRHRARDKPAGSSSDADTASAPPLGIEASRPSEIEALLQPSDFQLVRFFSSRRVEVAAQHRVALEDLSGAFDAFCATEGLPATPFLSYSSRTFEQYGLRVGTFRRPVRLLSHQLPADPAQCCCPPVSRQTPSR